MQQNSKYRLGEDRDKIVNHIISECSKLAQKEYKTRQDWVGKVIHLELYKRFRYNHANKCCMHKPDFLLENEMHKILWKFEILTDHLVLVRK